MLHFFTSWKNEKTVKFSEVFRSMEVQHLKEMVNAGQKYT